MESDYIINLLLKKQFEKKKNLHSVTPWTNASQHMFRMSKICFLFLHWSYGTLGAKMNSFMMLMFIAPSTGPESNVHKEMVIYLARRGPEVADWGQ